MTLDEHSRMMKAATINLALFLSCVTRTRTRTHTEIFLMSCFNCFFPSFAGNDCVAQSCGLSVTLPIHYSPAVLFCHPAKCAMEYKFPRTHTFAAKCNSRNFFSMCVHIRLYTWITKNFIRKNQSNFIGRKTSLRPIIGIQTSVHLQQAIWSFLLVHFPWKICKRNKLKTIRNLKIVKIKILKMKKLKIFTIFKTVIFMFKFASFWPCDYRNF